MILNYVIAAYVKTVNTMVNRWFYNCKSEIYYR